ncbi:DUF4129 domain-containing protein [Chloroflexota bacterium]
MSKSQKQKLIGLLISTSILLVLLGISLPVLQMKSGEMYLFQTSNQSVMGTSQGFENFKWFFLLIQGFLLFLIILTPIHIIISLLSKEGRRKLLSDLLKIALLFLVGMWLLDRGFPDGQPAPFEVFQPGNFDLSEIGVGTAAPPDFEANPQPWMLPLIMIGVAVVVAVITFFTYNFLSNRKSGDQPEFQDFADNAQNALKAIKEDKIDFNNVIIRCYAEMNQTLRIENGIQRDQAMTTNEFEQELLAKGFPAQPVQHLTQLFERVRYGLHQPEEIDKKVAIESLREIIGFCRGQK